ncbi:hypothetical protein M885DRAFT_552593 [Pelagophyceae sp. CCMP2097]|nr:hypothetical protein M885DRAFT_552593 [Pelagophyceae sp. CCMP2097]
MGDAAAAAAEAEAEDARTLLELPFADAFEEDSQTYPYGTHSAMASHVRTLRCTALGAAALSSLKASDVFVDLGCGVGAVTNLVAREVGCDAFGVDICELEVSAARLDAPANATYAVADLLDLPKHVPLESAPKLVLYMYLTPTMVTRAELRAMLEIYLERGARLVTAIYHPPHWAPASADALLGLNLYDATSLTPKR